MKLKTFILMLLLVASGSAIIAQDISIKSEDLPALARFFIRTDFSLDSITEVIKREADDYYNVSLENGTELEFDKNGTWMFVSCPEQVPVFIIPSKITHEVKKNCGNDIFIKRIRRLKRGRYEVELSNKLGLKFDKSLNIVDVIDPFVKQPN